MRGSALQTTVWVYCDIIKVAHRREFSSLITTQISMKMVLLAV